MYTVYLKNGESVSGDWDEANIQPKVAQNIVIATTVDFKGKDSSASFNLSEVFGWVKELEQKTTVAKKAS